jgi:Ca2+-binding RTX toxin-like protein
MSMDAHRFSLPARAALGGVVIGLIALAMLPAGADARPGCGGRKATVVAGNGDDVIRVAKKGPQVIVAGGGNDEIHSFRNKDRVCGGAGDDRIFGGPGRDKLYGGEGADLIDEGPGSGKVFGGGGDDTVLSGAGGDTVRAGAGADRLFGEIQDDQMFGELGDDLLVGGQGIDGLHGGAGQDWLRGDTNRDRYFGDEGVDTLSFATATPPGGVAGVEGVSVNLPANTATGDEWREPVFGIENLVGSAFTDSMIGTGVGWVRGNGAADACTGFLSSVCKALTTTGATARIADADGPDPGLVVMGGTGGDGVTVAASGDGLTVTGSALTPGSGCSRLTAGQLHCSVPPSKLGYVLIWGGAGNDSIAVGDSLATSTMFKGDGGPGNDTISGGPASDVLWAGESGSDRIFGNGGDDSVVGRPGGGDLLSGGPGSDQLASDDPCAGHTYDGGAGRADVAGFGHVSGGGVAARLGGKATMRGSPGCPATSIAHNAEILEGSAHSDLLIGDGRPNLLIGREGDDVLIGRGGRDELRGDAGGDRCIDGNAIKLSC